MRMTVKLAWDIQDTAQPEDRVWVVETYGERGSSSFEATDRAQRVYVGHLETVDNITRFSRGPATIISIPTVRRTSYRGEPSLLEEFEGTAPTITSAVRTGEAVVDLDEPF